MELLKPGLNVVLDAQWGSTGKGKLCGWIGDQFKEKLAYVCSSFGPNAGHTFIGDDGQPVVFRHLPSSACTTDCPVLLMPDSVIEVNRLLDEIGFLRLKNRNREVYVHPRAAVIIPADQAAAAATGRHLAGTMKGTGHAMSRKMLRIEGTQLAKDVLPHHMVADTCQLVRNSVKHGEYVLFEMSQGFDLSLNHGFEYPYLTSRDITIGAAINSCGVSHKDVSRVIGSMRTFPIRVGNVEGGYSGPCHHDQEELTWPGVTDLAGSPNQLREITTVTKRVRRVFSFSFMQMLRFVEHNKPDWLFLNFAQYLDWKANEAKSVNALGDTVLNFTRNLYDKLGVPIALVGTGASNSHIVKLGTHE